MLFSAGCVGSKAVVGETRQTISAIASIWLAVHTGRRDDLWSWLYVLVEMLDGGLCWRIGKDKADRPAEDAIRQLNSKYMDAEKQKKKEVAVKRKRAALADPDLLTGNVVLPGAELFLLSQLTFVLQQCKFLQCVCAICKEESHAYVVHLQAHLHTHVLCSMHCVASTAGGCDTCCLVSHTEEGLCKRRNTACLNTCHVSHWCACIVSVASSYGIACCALDLA